MYATNIKKGILLASFGSGSFQGEATLRRFDAQVRQAFPGVSVRWAFTSMLMRERLATARKKSDSVRKALDKMVFERFTHIAVQPVHVIPGLEYGDILIDVKNCPCGDTSIVVGEPLLTDSTASVERAAHALIGELPSERQPGEPVLFMGHGSRHVAERCYEALASAVQRLDPMVFMGTLNGSIRLEHIMARLKAEAPPVEHVWLLPLLAVVGRHTLEDMAGTSESSWRSRLEAEGIVSTPVLRGMMEYQGFMDIWVERLTEAMSPWDVPDREHSGSIES